MVWNAQVVFRATFVLRRGVIIDFCVTLYPNAEARETRSEIKVADSTRWGQLQIYCHRVSEMRQEIVADEDTTMNALYPKEITTKKQIKYQK